MKKILLVDDDPLSVEFMRLFVESDGNEVICACSYQEALTLFDQNMPDVLVTDINLSDGSGVDLAQYVKSKNNTKIIGVTGHSKFDLEQKGHDVSVFDTLLLKPIELDELRKSIMG